MSTSQTEKSSNTLVSVKIDSRDRERLSTLASAKKRTAHYLMKQAIHEYIQREETRLNFIRAGEASAQQFKETGLHIGLDEFNAWVEAVQTQPETAMPVCHK